MIHSLHSKLSFNRDALENMLLRRFFIAPSFEIYGGTAGLYDFGPPGTSLLANLINTWRTHFILHEDMLEIESTILTPYEVLKTSGHVDRFCDYMCKDTCSGDIYRADHLVESVLHARLEADLKARNTTPVAQTVVANNTSPGTPIKKTKQKINLTASQLDDALVAEYKHVLAQIDNYSGHDLGTLITKYKIVTPEGNPVTDPVEFNLMFDTNIGPTGEMKGYLRPETAQGQFVNFSKLLEYNNQKMPFASASIGKSFRNEISPRNGLLRVREFLMAEIEHFVDPLNKQHPSFDSHAHVVLNLLPAQSQLAGQTKITQVTMGQAVMDKMIDNQTLGYYLARIQLFLIKIGICPDLIRFRQHMSNEMAHYACDCWDAELKSSYGWIECVGCADRSAFDLTKHSERTNKKLVVRQPLSEPLITNKWTIVIDQKQFGLTYKKQAKPLQNYLMQMTEPEILILKNQLDSTPSTLVTLNDGQTYELTRQVLSIQQVTVKEHVREYVPNVIEPSFGIGRIFHTLLEHVFYTRPHDVNRGVLKFVPGLAPVKVLLLPLSNDSRFDRILVDLKVQFRELQLATRVDDSASSIGKRYARNDELGTPFAVTVDFETLVDQTVTLRERDSTEQVRVQIDVCFSVVADLVRGRTRWQDVVEQYPKVKSVPE